MKSWTRAYVIAKEIEYAELLEALENLGGDAGLEYWENLAQNL